jgi:hypothetical protein
MKNTKPLFLPSNLDIDNLAIKNRIYINNKEEDKYRLLLTLSNIIKNISKKDIKDFDSEFVPIKMEYLRVYIDKADLYVKRLIELGIVECDNKYIIGLKSKGYRLAYPYNSTPKVIIPGKNYTNQFDKKSFIGSFDKDSKELKPLYSHFNDNLEIDYKSAIKEGFIKYWTHDGEKAPIFIDDVDFENLNSVSIKKKGQGFTNLAHRKAYHKFINGTIIPSSMLLMKQFYFNVDKSGYRLHTNLTNLNKEKRKYITYNGKRLIAWDLKNSQPFFLNVLLSKDFWSRDNEILGYRSLKGELRSKACLHAVGIDPSITMEKLRRIQSSGAFEEFKNVTLQGNLYEILQDFTLKYSDITISRERAKEEFIRLLFDKPYSKRNYHYDIEVAFIFGFPGLIESLDSLFKSKKYNTLALLLQQIESNVILRYVCPAIAQKYPEIPLFTIHDSIVTTEGNEELIRPIIEQEIRRVTGGFTPMLKLEKWF